ncbi:ABC transporter permease [Streptomyces sp. NPDC002809]|uniref:ABC transporter permease n=1 Tax=Streptomyces sp. NPDC002809 TaxID=3154433 RepID=UPI00331A1B2C
MSTVAAARIAPGRTQVSFPRVLRSEWMKLWSVRSTGFTMGLAVILVMVIGVAACFVFDPTGTTPADAGTDGVSLATNGAMLAQLCFGVLGVIFSAGEYGNGMIRATMSAVPRRAPVLWAKALVLAVAAFLVAGVTVAVTFVLGAGALDGTAFGLSLSDPGVLRALAGTTAYLALVGVIGVALGFVLRSVAGGVAVIAGVVFVIDSLTFVLPASVADAVIPYLPGHAGRAMMSLHGGSDLLSPGAGAAVLVGWAVVVLGVGALRLTRSDV